MTNSGTQVEQSSATTEQSKDNSVADPSLSSTSFFKDADTNTAATGQNLNLSPVSAIEESVSHATHAHHATLAESIAQEHAAMRASGQEGQILGMPSLLKVVKGSTGVALNNSASTEALPQADGLSLLALGKKKSGLTGDREIDEIIQKHPELAQYVQKLIEARDEALKNAQEGVKDAMASKDALLAKLDVIATLLEGAPLAPQLRMGDITVKDAFVALTASQSKDPEFAVAAEYVWDKARANMLEKEQLLDRDVALELVRKAEELGKRRGEMLSRSIEPSSEQLRAFEQEREQIRQSVSAHFGPNSPMNQQISIAIQRSEDRARAEVVAARVWELQYRLEIARGRANERQEQEALDAYMRRQSDLIDRLPAFHKALNEHVADASKAGTALRRDCDSASRSLYRAMDGWGTDDNSVYSALKYRSQLELQVIRERYKEQYDEDLAEALDGDFDGSDYDYVMSLYHGDPNKTGWENHPLSADKLGTAFASVDREKEVDALLSGERGKVAAVLMEGALQTSQYVAADISRIIETTRASAQEVKAAQAELQTRDVVSALEQRADLVSACGGNQVAVRVEKAGVDLARSTLSASGATTGQVVEYAQLVSVDHGLNLGHSESAENPSSVQRGAIEQQYESAARAFTGLYTEYPGIRETLAQTVEQVRVSSYQAGINSVMHKYGYELGLMYGDDKSQSDKRKQFEVQVERYRAMHKEYFNQHKDADKSAVAALEAGKREGIDSMVRVAKSVDLLTQGMIGMGTNEDKSFVAVRDRSSRELFLIHQLYRERNKESVETSIEGDFSHAERDKMYSLVDMDRVGVAAADAQLALSKFWGPDNEALRATLTTLGSETERAEFKSRFDNLYASDFSRSAPGGEGEIEQAKSFEEALSFKLGGDNLIIAQALYEGNQAKADAGIVHQKIDGTFTWHYEEGASYLDGLRRADGTLDSSRVTKAAEEFSAIYKIDLRTVDKNDTDTNARWIAASARGDEVAAGAYSIQYGIEEEEAAIVKQALRVPAQLEQQIWYEQTHLGGISEATQAQLNSWNELKQKKIDQYNTVKPNPERSIFADLQPALSQHDMRIVTSLIQNGYLTRADVIADSCDGLGTRVDPIRDATSGLTKAQLKNLRQEFSDKGYGNLDALLNSELSGDEHFDIVTINLAGIPETREEMRQLVALRYAHETSGILVSDGIGAQAASVAVPVIGIARLGLGFWWADERERLDRDYQRAMSALSSDSALSGEAGFETTALYRRFNGSADNFRAEKNHVTEVVTEAGTVVIMVGTTAVMVVGSGGTATPAAIAMWSLVGGAGAGAFRIGTNYAIRGDGYGSEEFARDGAVFLADVALMGAMSKLPVGHMVASEVEQLVGEAMVGRTATAIAANGARLAEADVFHSAVQASRIARMSIGAVQGTVDSAIMAPVQTAVATGFSENTWRDGVGKGFLRIGEASLESIPAALSVGAMTGSVVRLRTPLAIKEGRVLSVDKADALRVKESLGVEGRALLEQRELAKGFVTRGDLAEATLASKALGADESRKLLDVMRAAPEGQFTQADIEVVEARLRTRGYLTALDAAIIRGERLPQGITVLTAERLERMLSEAQARVGVAQARAQSAGANVTPEMNAAIQQAQGRVDALTNLQSGGSATDLSRFLTPSTLPDKTNSQVPAADGAGRDISSRAQVLETDQRLPRKLRQNIAEAQAEVRDLEANKSAKKWSPEALELIEEELAKKRTKLADAVRLAEAEQRVVSDVPAEIPSDSEASGMKRSRVTGSTEAAEVVQRRDVKNYVRDNDISTELRSDIRKAGAAVENYENLLKKGGHSKGAQTIIEEELAKERARLDKLLSKADQQRIEYAQHDKEWGDFDGQADGFEGGSSGGSSGGGGRGPGPSGGAGRGGGMGEGSYSTQVGGRRGPALISEPGQSGGVAQARGRVVAEERAAVGLLEEPQILPEIEFSPIVEVAPGRVVPRPAVKSAPHRKPAVPAEPLPEVVPPKPADATPASPAIRFANRSVQLRPEQLPVNGPLAAQLASVEAAREVMPQPRLSPRPQPFPEPSPKPVSDEVSQKVPPTPKWTGGEGGGRGHEDEGHKLKLSERRKEEQIREKKKLEKPVHRGGHKRSTVHVFDSLGESDQEVDQGD
ncbi:MAG: hypothetical protein K1X79_12570 [Oligoflexia bacterium]|nr:hypothetical protein [Oligoflexia bacterium]